MFLKRLKGYFRKLYNKLRGRKPPQTKISLLIPFRANDPQRLRVFKWLLEYWKHELPDAEIIIGRAKGQPFSKTRALNNAAKKATGQVLVILDADAYIPGRVIQECADMIVESPYPLWFVPYRHLFRLNKRVTKEIIASDPKDPLRLPTPPRPEDIDHTGQHSSYGHRYGAMITIIPREAIYTIGCFDERFKGWGGEDVALLRALDTLYGKHKTTGNAVFHLWHPVIGKTYKDRMWKGQQEQLNNQLSMRYHQATGHPTRMRNLVDESCKDKGKDKRK